MSIRDATTIEEIAYSPELRELIIKAHVQEITLGCAATMSTIKQLMQSGHIRETELEKTIMGAMTGMFIIGFKQGNDYFLEEAEKEKHD